MNVNHLTFPPISPEAVTNATRGHWLPTGAYGLSRPLSFDLNEIKHSLHINVYLVKFVNIIT